MGAQITFETHIMLRNIIFGQLMVRKHMKS